jgi:hypothetical protein
VSVVKQVIYFGTEGVCNNLECVYIGFSKFNYTPVIVFLFLRKCIAGRGKL